MVAPLSLAGKVKRTASLRSPTRSAWLRPQAASNEFEDFVRGEEPLVIDGALDAGKASADFFKGVLDDEDFRRRTTYLAMRVLYDRYRTELPA